MKRDQCFTMSSSYNYKNAFVQMNNDPINLFIGTSSNCEDAEAEMVYEYTLRKNTKANLNITWMRQTNDKSSIWSEWNTSNWSTPFSGFRWAIPEACNFNGRAIYTDVDMINLKDIEELNSLDLNDKPMAARIGSRFGGHEFCVIVFDCEKMEPLIPSVERMKNIPGSHVRMINMFSGNFELIQEMDSRWNCLDGDDRKIDDIWQLHFSRMSTQPWSPSWFTGEREEHPRDDLIELWWKLRAEAFSNGCVLNNTNLNIVYNFIGK